VFIEGTGKVFVTLLTLGVVIIICTDQIITERLSLVQSLGGYSTCSANDFRGCESMSWYSALIFVSLEGKIFVSSSTSGVVIITENSETKTKQRVW
jgi:hypothetical protein